jgi:hypothetical protein
MAIAVIAGLSFATVLTLILVPVMYSLVDDFATMMVRSFTAAGAEAAEARAGERSRGQRAARRPRRRLAGVLARFQKGRPSFDTSTSTS